MRKMFLYILLGFGNFQITDHNNCHQVRAVPVFVKPLNGFIFKVFENIFCTNWKAVTIF